MFLSTVKNYMSSSKKIDNGYYPHKHDDAVFQQVANHFAIKKKDAVDIYNSYSKLAAKLEMMRINRLPEKKRKAALNLWISVQL